MKPGGVEAAGEHTLEWPWHATWVCQSNPAHIEIATRGGEGVGRPLWAALTMTDAERRHLVIWEARHDNGWTTVVLEQAAFLTDLWTAA